MKVAPPLQKRGKGAFKPNGFNKACHRAVLNRVVQLQPSSSIQSFLLLCQDLSQISLDKIRKTFFNRNNSPQPSAVLQLLMY